MTTGTPDWAGIRQAHGTEQVLIDGSTTLAKGQSKTYTVPIVRPGYILELHAWNATDGTTKLPFSILVTWEDGMSGDGLDRQLWQAYAGTVAGPHYIDGSGPTKGGTMVVKITNNAASAVTLAWFIIIDETSFSYSRHDWRTDDVFSFNPTGWSTAHVDMIGGVLASEVNRGLAAGATDIFILPLYSGRVRIHVDGNVTSGTQLEFLIQADGEVSLPNPPIVLDQQLPTTLATEIDAWLPRSQCTIRVANHRATAGLTYDLGVFTSEY